MIRATGLGDAVNDTDPQAVGVKPAVAKGADAASQKTADLANVGGGNAKDVGTYKAATNMVDVENEFSNQFKVNNPVGFTGAAGQYSTDVLKVNTKPYAPGGRIAI